MAVTEHPTRSLDWCIPEVEGKERESFFVNKNQCKFAQFVSNDMAWIMDLIHFIFIIAER